jgi:hypothetical protein
MRPSTIDHANHDLPHIVFSALNVLLCGRSSKYQPLLLTRRYNEAGDCSAGRFRCACYHLRLAREQQQQQQACEKNEAY